MEQSLRLLIVDDNEQDCEVLRQGFEATSLQVILEQVRSRATAIAALGTQDYDCLLLSTRLPHQDGLTLLQEIRTSTVNLPILVLARPEADPKQGSQWLQAGALDYLPHAYGLAPDYLLLKIRNAIRLHQADIELRQTQLCHLFLEASTLLANCKDNQTALKEFARLAVTEFADWCMIDLVQSNQQYVRLTVAHANPDSEALIWQPQHHALAKTGAVLGYPPVLQIGEPEVYFHISEQKLDQMGRESTHLKLLQPLYPRSYMCVPLLLGKQILGALTFGLSESNQHYTPTDLILAQALAQRIALAIENARLSQESQDMGESLRRAIVVLGEQQQQLKTLQHLTNRLNQSLGDLPALLQVIVNAVCDAIHDAEFSLIGLYQPDQDQLKHLATKGISTEQLLKALSADKGLLSHIDHKGVSRWTLELSLPQHPTGKSSTPRKIPTLIYAVSIESAQGGRLGVLAIGGGQNISAFKPEVGQLLGAFAEQAAIAISNAQLINTLAEREERLAAQNEVLLQQNEKLEQQRQQIQLQNLQLIEATQLKTQFLATMSHELRTPINAITGFSQLLLRQRQHPLSDQHTNMVERILNNGQNLLALIDDILDLSKIEAGRMELHLEEVNLKQLITLTVAELQSLADQKGLTLDIKIQLDNPQIINDSARLRQVLVNLLSNAIKFTETGEVEVVAAELSSEKLAIAVRDTGIGIAPLNFQLLFDEFWQADQTTTRRYQGTGLGLSICQRLLRIMGGNIQVQSQLGQGSTFWIELPRQVSL